MNKEKMTFGSKMLLYVIALVFDALAAFTAGLLTTFLTGFYLLFAVYVLRRNYPSLGFWELFKLALKSRKQKILAGAKAFPIIGGIAVGALFFFTVTTIRDLEKHGGKTSLASVVKANA